jgi:hypothetical protein
MPGHGRDIGLRHQRVGKEEVRRRTGRGAPVRLTPACPLTWRGIRRRALLAQGGLEHLAIVILG